jgi:hypothetical protein
MSDLTLNSELAFDPSIERDITFRIKELIEDCIKDSDEVNLSISKEDEMLIYPLEILKVPRTQAILDYYNTSINILEIIKQIINWKMGEFNSINSYLDFASGYGRVTRFLVHLLPPERIWIADIYEEGVNFQTENFGVNGIVSKSLPEQINIYRKFDVISVISFFSHLPETTFLGWLNKLYELLEDQGILLFSTHGIDCLPTDVSLSDQGITFIPDSESRSLDPQEYGSTYVTEKYVRQAVDQVTNGKGKVHLIPKGINDHQDLYLVIKDAEEDFKSLQILKKPLGNLDSCIVSSSHQLSLSGWAITSNSNAEVKVIKIYINDQLCQECTPSFDRPDVVDHYKNEGYLNSGWKCLCSLDSNINLQEAVIKVKVVDNLGAEEYIYKGKIVKTILKKPLGNLDSCIVSSSHQLSLSGWATTSNPKAEVKVIKIYINDQLCQECTPSFDRPDVVDHYKNEGYLNSGWKCLCSLDSNINLQEAVIKVKVVDNLGAENYIYTGKIIRTC